MKAFSAMEKMKQTAVSIVALTLGTGEIEQLRKVMQKIEIWE